MRKIALFIILTVSTFSYHKFKVENFSNGYKTGGWTEKKGMKASFEIELNDFENKHLEDIATDEVMSYTNFEGLTFLFEKEKFLNNLNEKNLRKFRNKKIIKRKDFEFNNNLSEALDKIYGSFEFNLYDKDNQKIKDITVAQLKGYKLVVWSEKKAPALYWVKGYVCLDNEGNELFMRVQSPSKIRMSEEQGEREWSKDIKNKPKLEAAFY